MSETVNHILEIQNPEFSIQKTDNGFEVFSPHVELDSRNPPLEFSVTLEKMPTSVTDGTVIQNINIDSESQKLQRMMNEARLLREIPERERPRRLLTLLRSNVNYAYDEVINELAKSNPELAAWVIQNTGVNSSSSNPLKLSEIIDAGHAVCRHLAVAYLKLASEAGMEGAYLVIGRSLKDGYGARNVVRRDNGKPLFRMMPVGDYIGGHAMAELRLSDGEWIPVDPSTQLVGDTDESMEIFRDADYRATPGYSLEAAGFPGSVDHLGMRNLWFLPGEREHKGILEVNSKEKLKPWVISRTPKVEPDHQEQWPKPTSYKGPLTFQVYSHEDNDGMNVVVNDVDFVKK